ncbi:hypothetical protein DSO57_1017970 [Entomophthora muscae]|uniref:Uncharacterized protein n=1 Tax=Entomophthora muscae TaxID=34485 RepID=A0ACC2SHA7_9FUNG|nr:hypothetical protein DSO57_1017970 [Entomophthora muscae]
MIMEPEVNERDSELLEHGQEVKLLPQPWSPHNFTLGLINGEIRILGLVYWETNKLDETQRQYSLQFVSYLLDLNPQPFQNQLLKEDIQLVLKCNHNLPSSSKAKAGAATILKPLISIETSPGLCKQLPVNQTSKQSAFTNKKRLEETRAPINQSIIKPRDDDAATSPITRPVEPSHTQANLQSFLSLIQLAGLAAASCILQSAWQQPNQSGQPDRLEAETPSAFTLPSLMVSCRGWSPI